MTMAIALSADRTTIGYESFGAGMLLGQGHQATDYDPRQFVRAVVDFDARPSGANRCFRRLAAPGGVVGAR
jgi:hypothetical protein